MGQTQVRGTQLLDESVDYALDVNTPVSVKSSNYSLTAADTVIIADTTSSGFTLTLPSAVPPSGTSVNGPYRIKNVGTNTLTIDTTSSQTIDGNVPPLELLFQNTSVDLVSDGSNWFIQ